MNRLDSLPHRLTTAVILTLALLLPGRVAAQELLADEQNTMNIANTAGPSVVAVRIAGLEGMPSRGSERGLTGGSGFVVDADGLIITNFHVVAGALAKTDDDNLALVDGASISVSYAGNPQQDYPVTLKGANPDIDMALLELKQPDQAPRRDPIPLGDSDQVKVGQKVVVIGNPFGLHSSVTAGIVSGVERERPGLVGIKIPYIQTDAAINPGNSGGPMLNSAGEVIGISNVVLSPAGTFAGISLAVPVNLLHESMSDLKAGGLSVAWLPLPQNYPKNPDWGCRWKSPWITTRPT